MDESILWAAVAALAALGALQLGILKWVSSIATGLATRLTLAEATAKTADAVAAGAMGKCEIIGTDFHNYRVEIASSVARIDTKADFAAAAIISAENRLAKSMEDFGDRLDGIVERLDRMLEMRSQEPRSREA